MHLTAINGSVVPQIIMTDMLTVIYLIVPFVFLVISADFAAGAVKNTLSSGMSRAKYYLAKLILVFGVNGASSGVASCANRFNDVTEWLWATV